MYTQQHYIEYSSLPAQQIAAITKLPQGAMMFDITTSGLSHKSSIITVLTSADFSDVNSRVTITQRFCTQPSAEFSVIIGFLHQLYENKCTCLINYRGTGYAVPFLNAKFEEYGVDDQISPVISVDLHRRAKLIRGQSLKRQDFERIMRIDRPDDTQPKDCAELYRFYMAHKNLPGGSRTRDKLLKHSYHNVAGMLGMLQILTPPDFPIYLTRGIAAGFPVWSKRSFSVSICSPYDSFPTAEYEDGCNYSAEGSKAKLIVPLSEILVDIKDPESGEIQKQKILTANPRSVYGRTAENLSASERKNLINRDWREIVRHLVLDYIPEKLGIKDGG